MGGSRTGTNEKVKGGLANSGTKSETEKKQNVSKQKPQKPKSIKSSSGKVKKNSNVSTAVVHKTKISVDDLLKICKPVTINLIRLPDYTRNKHVPLPIVTTVQRKHKKHLWSKGKFWKATYRVRKRKRERKKKALESKQLQLQGEMVEKIETKVKDSSEISKNKITGIQTNDSIASETTKKKLHNVEIEASTVIDSVNAQNKSDTLIQSSKNELLTAKKSEINAVIRKEDSTSEHNCCNELPENETIVPAVADKISNELPSIDSSNTNKKTEPEIVNAEKHLNQHSQPKPELSKQERSQLIRKRSAKRLSIILSGYRKKRKKRSLPDDDESKQLLSSIHNEKKCKVSESLLSDSNTKTVVETPKIPISEPNIEVTSNVTEPSSATVSSERESARERRRLQQRLRRQQQREQRGRGKRKPSNVDLAKDVRIIVNRLDDLQDPLICKWKNNVNRAQKTELSDTAVIVPEEESRLVDYTSDKSNDDERQSYDRPITRSKKGNVESLGLSENTEEQVPPASLSTDDLMKNATNNALEMMNCDDEEDDEEIMEFMATHKALTKFSSENSAAIIIPSFSGRLTRSKSRLALDRMSRYQDYTTPISFDQNEEINVESQSIQSNGECGRVSVECPNSGTTDDHRVSPIIKPSSSDEEEVLQTQALRRNKCRMSIDSTSSEGTYNSVVTEIDGRQSTSESIRSHKSVSTDSLNSHSTLENVNAIGLRNRRRTFKRLAMDDSDSESTYETDEESNKSIRATMTTPSSDQSSSHSSRSRKSNRRLSGTCDDDTRDEMLSKRGETAVAEQQVNSLTEENNVSQMGWDSNYEENIVARRKLTALRNAMVVLTRLEDFTNEIGSDDVFDSDTELEFRECEEYEPITNGSHESVDENESTTATGNCVDAGTVVFHRSLTTVSKISEKKMTTAVDSILENSNMREKSRSTVGHRKNEESVGNRDEMRQQDTQHVDDDMTEDDVEITLVLEENNKLPSNSSIRSESADRSLNVVASEKINNSRNAEPESEAVESSVAVPLANGILVHAVDNTDNTHIPEVICSDEDVVKQRKHCSCVEYQRDKRNSEYQKIPATSKCLTCNGFFRNAQLAQQHRSETDVHCDAEFSCTVCHVVVATQIDLTKHRENCVAKDSRDRNSVNAPSTTNQEDSTAERQIEKSGDDSRISLPAISEQPPLVSSPPPPPPLPSPPRPSQNEKRKKQQTARNLSKKSRQKCLPRIDSLKCSVCSITFATRTDLSEHIFKHSAEELQEAYRIAKAKAMADCLTGGKPVSTTNAGNTNSETVVDKTTSNQVMQQIENLTQSLSVQMGHQSVSNAIAAITTASTTVTTTNVSSVPSVANICSCHKDNFQACPDKTDLQIEMVLLCQYCKILFRRRECFEVHYRTSLQCASDRSRGRWSKLFCANCRVTLNTWGEMRHHLEVHARQNAEGTVRFVCNICRVVFFGFGALFYNHWLSHLRDSMFVASRYTFPKASIQPTNGTDKLPLGARPNEIYLFVAEHVCAICKESFSTRHDLELHEETHKTIEKQRTITNARKDVDNNDTLSSANERKSTSADDLRWYCDMCDILFSSRNTLNDHGTIKHARRFVCVATSPKIKAFMCTRCFSMRKSVRDVEEHWQIDKQHIQQSSIQEIDAATQTVEFVDKDAVVVTSSVSDDAEQQQLDSNEAVDPLMITTKDVTHAKTKSSTKDSHDTSVSQTTTETNCRQSPISSTANPNDPRVENTNVESMTLLRDKNLSSTNDADIERQTENEIRNSEEPGLIDVVLPDHSEMNLTASLIIDETKKYTHNTDANEAKAESYEILLMDKTVPGHIKMVFGRLAGNAEKQNDRQNYVSNGNSAHSSTNTSVIEKPNGAAITVAVEKETRMDNIERKETTTRPSPKKSVGKQNDVYLTELLKKQPILPEIIEIVDEVEGTVTEDGRSEAKTTCDGKTDTQMQNISVDSSSDEQNDFISKVASITNDAKIDNKRHNKNSDTIDLQRVESKTNAALKKILLKSETCSNTSGTSKSRHSYLVNAANLSFEEARFRVLEASKGSHNEDREQPLVTAKKSGFLRVKNLSELQAVRTHICKHCDASFESSASLQEHNQIHLRSTLVKSAKYPKGMTAALVLPDPSERPNTPILSNQPVNSVASAIANAFRKQSLQDQQQLQQQQQQQLQLQQQQYQQPPVLPPPPPYVPQQLVGYNCRASGPSTNPWDSPIINISVNPTGGSVKAPGEEARAAAAAAVVATWIQLEQSKSSTFSAPHNESMPRVAASQIATSSVTTVSPITTSTTNSNILQVRENSGSQVQISGSVAVLDSNRKITESRAGQVGLHVMPAMVMAPSGQGNKQQATPAPQRSSCTNYLPFTTRLLNGQLTYQPIETNKFLCNICKIFRCATLQEFNNHVSQHYNSSGWKTVSTGQNNTTMSGKVTSVLFAPAVTSAGTTGRPDGSGQDITGYRTYDSTEGAQRNSILNHMVAPNWSVKNTPHGPMWVTPKSSSSTIQNQSSGLTTFSPQTTSNSTTPQNLSLARSGKTVYRCMICKTALFKNYIDLRNHVMRAHDIKEIPSAGQENIVQQNYQCVYCPNEISVFENEDKWKHHFDTFHTNACPGCRRQFISILTLKSHIKDCLVEPRRDNQNSSFDNNR